MRPRDLLLCSMAVAFGHVASAQSIYFVDASATGANDGSSWSDAFTDLQDAIATMEAFGTDQVWIAEEPVL